MIQSTTDSRQVTPIDIVYNQIERVLRERADGQGASEAMAGLMDMVSPLKDREWYEDMRTTPDNLDADQVTHWTFDAVIRLLERKKLWTMRMVVRYGEEMIQGI